MPKKSLLTKQGNGIPRKLKVCGDFVNQM